MKNSNLYSLLIFVSILTIVSCQKDKDEALGKKGLIPLKTGNSWSYKVYRSGIVTDTVLLTVGDYITISGNSGFKLMNGYSPFRAISLIDNDNEGNCISVGGYSDKDTLFAPSVKYKVTVKKGDAWNFQEISYNENGVFEKVEIPMVCTSTDTTIVTSIGDFKCKAYKWSPDSGADWFFDYISENTGIIKSEHFEGSHLFSYQVLYSYKVEN